MKKSDYNLTKEERKELQEILHKLRGLERGTDFQCEAISNAIAELQNLDLS